MSSHRVQAVAVTRREATGQALAQAARPIGHLRLDVHVGTLDELRRGAPAERGIAEAHALLLEVEPGDTREIASLRALLAARFARLPVIAVAADASLEDARRLLHCGVVDVIAPTADAADIEGALAHALRQRPAPPAGAPSARGRVIALLKAGGGAGATTLAVQAGCLLAGGSGAGQAPCLLDLDVQFGAAALYLDLDGRVGLGDLLEAPERLDSALLLGAMSRHESGLAVLAAPSEIAPLDALTPAFADELLDLACREYATVLVDLPQAWTPWSAAVLANADVILLVAQMTVASVRQARRQLDRLEREGVAPGAARLVLNRAPLSWRARARRREAERALGRRFDAVVANDFPLVREAIDRGVPLRAVRRRSRTERGIRGLLDALDEAGAAARVPAAGAAVLTEA